MTQKYFDGRLPAKREALEEQDSGLLDAAAGLRGRYEEQMEKYAFQNALAQVFQVIGRANKYIDENEPWRLAKDEARKPRLARVLYNLLETIRISAGLLRPFMPETADEIMRRLGGASSDWESLGTWGVLPRDAAVQNGPALFPGLTRRRSCRPWRPCAVRPRFLRRPLCRSRCRKLPLTCSSRWR